MATSVSNPPPELRGEAAIDWVLATALAFVGFQEVGANRGQVVEEFLKHVWLKPGQPWCAAYVSWVGHRALVDWKTGKSRWPVLRAGGCASIGDHARKQKMLVSTPQRGDVFLLYYPSLRRFAHTGFILGEDPETPGQWLTVEGNTNSSGGREGFEVARRSRRFGQHDRFVRWSQKL